LLPFVILSLNAFSYISVLKPSLQHWVAAARLRTLPLALSSILAGGLLAMPDPAFESLSFVLIVLTAIFLQVLSNFANDYGDSIHGADSSERKGPKRFVQQGLISSAQMKRAVWFFAILSFVAGLSLLLFSAYRWGWEVLVLFLVLGIFAIAAAITYTAGSLPYGYYGLGDISVLFFFGIVGVCGTNFLLIGKFIPNLLFPALSLGLFAVGVLNLNNLRDVESDQKAGKLSIPVRLGYENGKIYHYVILIAAMGSGLLFALLEAQKWTQWLFILSYPFFIFNLIAVGKAKDPQSLDPLLKKLALSTLFFALLLGIGAIL
jgi:1,4-dihydroxy-2-naphthoate octaprenyltransferase